LLAAILYFVLRRAAAVDWPSVGRALGSYGTENLAYAFAFALPAFIACATFDLFGRHATQHRLSVPHVMLISYTGYYFSLNLGALVGGLAFRYRLYVPYGFSPMTIGEIIALSVITNWSGYVLMAGAVLAYQPPDFPPQWGVSTAVMRGTGVALLAAAGAYIALCALRGGMRVRWKGSNLRLPTIRVAGLQILASMTNWAGIGAVISWLLPGEIGWMEVMPVLMISAIAGLWSHIPGGLGVTEAVFLELLGHRLPENEVLAAVLVFRALYYVAPFAVAIIGYLYLEATAKGKKGEAAVERGG
jgi:uncharacterized membrane protein YbhN (UPF0104 family)